ncbi:MAG: GNAT family N-acetyltransferase [Deltaproteobacteria bacterium]|nr:MAG: GNAT family N-acetyltransferase [Deltaproteobacteria bacterium]
MAARGAHPFLVGEGTGERARLIREVYLPLAETWVWESQGRVEGFVSLLAHDDGPWEIGGLFVAPDAQRGGIGSALVAHAATLKGALVLTVFERNHSARAAYARMGFVPTGARGEDSGVALIELGRAG